MKTEICESECYVKAELSDDIKKAIQELRSIYDDSIIDFLAGLYDPDTGLFYFAYSGRNTIGYGPDLESTRQIFSALDEMLNPGEKLIDYFHDGYDEKLVAQVQGMEDKDDGYWYHEQWGKNVIASRKSRDLGWAVALLERFGTKPLYSTALDILSGSATATVAAATTTSTVPIHLQSEENLEAWIKGLKWDTDPYLAGSTVAERTSLIKAAGLLDKAIEVLSDIQNTETGLWGNGVSYDTVSSHMKSSMVYRTAGVSIPYAEEALQSIIEVTLNEEIPNQITHIYNPWVCISNIRTLTMVDKEVPEWFNEALYSNAAQMILKSKEKLEVFKKDNGGFSYNPDKASTVSQMAPVSLGLAEGDVNATCLAKGVLRNVCLGLGVDYESPFDTADLEHFMEIMQSVKAPVKRTEEVVINACYHEKTKVEAKEVVSCADPGNIAYWRCDTCNKCFLDETGMDEVPYEDTVITNWWKQRLP